MPTARAISTAVLLSTATLLASSLTACAPTDQERDRRHGTGGTTTDAQALTSLRSQSPDWKPCPAPSPAQGGGKAPTALPDGTRWQCATLRTPLDWKKPSGDTIDLALIRARSSGTPDDRIGSLLFNFGGPGGSGVATLPGLAADYEKLRTRYDLVSFDPRGVGNSAPVRCLDAALPDEDDIDHTPDDGTAEANALVRFNRATAVACQKNSGDVLPHVGTTQTAQDLDLLRQVLGDARLHYLGISYGTELGGVYAHLFPDHVGRAVLDGVVDPTHDTLQEALAQARGFQLAFEHFATWCAQQGCALGADADAVVKLTAALEKTLDDTPLPTPDGGELDGDALIDAVSGALYRQDYWPALRVGLEAAADDDADVLHDLAEALGQRGRGGGTSGEKSNEDDAFRAITCDDSSNRYTVADVESRLPDFLEASPLFGPGLAWSLLTCDGWPVPGTAPHPEVSAPGAPPILLVGNTGDPATPYEGTARMAERLGGKVGVELTYQGEGHGAYDSGNTCVRNAVNTYLLTGGLPAPGTVCEATPLPEGK
ncbi:alpha/beta hydrolase [Streptomyces sp. NRRL F-5650]|uniref:alpha/beta hydrolase n=1 Tax=Streptomyces sp. NRRL F-5650 TaxID=1463868 RepID=UPI0004C4DD68|nr:alpha/beta hydrolase [Streptomyces sp. NRRL F-5650]